MAQIATIPGSFQVNTPSANIQANSAALNVGNRVAMENASDVGQIGRQLGDVALRVQQAVNYGIAADADRKMRETSAQFQLSLAGRPDEDKWESEWQEKSNEMWSQLSEQTKMNPALSRQLSSNFKDWQSANGIEVRTMATKQKLNRATERVGLAADEAAKDGDVEGIDRVFSGAVETGLMLPEEAEKARRNYLTRIDEYEARNFIDSNPAQAYDFISAKDKDGKYVNLTKLNPDQRATMLNAADRAFKNYQNENYQDLITDAQNKQLKTPDQLQVLVDQKVITARQRKTYEAAYYKGQYNMDVAETSNLYSDISRYDPSTDPNFEKRTQIMQRISASGFSEDIQSDMKKFFDQKLNPESTLNTPVAKDIFADIQRRFTSGAYGDFEKRMIDKKTGAWVTIVNHETQERAMATRNRVEDYARKYLQMNPKATAEEANRAVAEFQSRETQKAVARPVLNTIGIPTIPAQQSPEDMEKRLEAILGKGR
jgi:hypothetical protein